MICHDYKCIFIHIPKVAGQSVEHYFLKKVGLDWDTRAPLLLSKNNDPNAGPPRLAHLTGTEYIKYHYLTQEVYDSYYKFSFVRDPYTRTLSFYKYLGYQSMMTFETFVKIYLPKLLKNEHWFLMPQANFLYDGDKPLADFIGKFENINADFATVCKALNFTDTKLPHANKSVKEKYERLKLIRKDPSVLAHFSFNIKESKNPNDYYTDELRELVYNIYKVDFEKFGY